MRRTLLLSCWLAPAAVAAPPAADVSPSVDPAVRVPATPLPPAEAARRDALTRFGLGLIHARNEQPAQAARQHQTAADKDPAAVAPQRELARLYAELGRDPAAIRAARQVLDRDPTDHETARLLGRLLTDARQFADAAKALRAAADSPALTDPVAKLGVLKELTRAADSAGDAKAGEAARRDALKLIADKKASFLHPDVFTPAELDRERMRLYEGLGVTLVKQGQYAPASAAFQTARDLAADPKGANDPAGVARLHWHLSGSLLAQGDATESLWELEKYLTFRPAAFEPYERLVELYRRLNRADELSGVLARHAAANRKNPAPQWLAAAAGMSRDPDTTDVVVRKLFGGLKSADEARVLVAAYREANRPKELLDLLDRAAKAGRPATFEDPDAAKSDAEPDPPPAEAVERVRLLTAAVKAVPPKGGFTRILVKQLADDARSQTDRHPDTLELVSGLATRDGLAPTVIDPLWAFARRKSSLRVTWLLLTHLTSQRRWPDVIDAADELKTMRRNKQQFIYYGIAAQAAVAFAELGREREALAKLTDIGGGFYADEQRIRVLNLLGKHADALKAFDKVMDKDRPAGRDLRAFRLLQADTLNLLKRFADAEAVLRQLLDDDPDDVLVLNNLGYNLADQGRKLDEAEILIRRAIELDRFERMKRGDPEAESGGYQDSLGWVLFRRGKLKEARELLEQAVGSTESAPDGIVWDHLGDVAFRQGDTKRAATAWEKAEKLFKDSHVGRQNGRLDEVRRKIKLAE